MAVDTIDRRVTHWAEVAPDRVAAMVGENALSYASLDALAREVAAAWAAAGVGPGDVLAWVGRNDLVHPVLLAACAHLGGVLVSTNWRGTAEEIAHVLHDARAVAVVVAPEFATLVAPGPWIRVELEETLDPHELPQQILQAPAPAFTRQETPPHDRDLLALTYTSGTTGPPKGVMIGMRQVSSYAFRDTPWIPTEDDSILIVSPVFHTAGWVWVALGLIHGATVVLIPDADPAEISTAIRQHKPTITLMVPSLISILLAEPKARVSLRNLRMLSYGAAPMPPALVRELRELAPRTLLAQGYGLSETTGTITSLGPEEHVPGATHLESVGRALPGIDIAVFEPETDDQVAAGEIGEIRTRSEQNTPGYWLNPAASRALIRDGWLRTGDLGLMVDGYIYLVDRVDDIIRSGGEKVAPSEIEAVIAAVPGVRDVCVVGVPDERWGQSVTAVVVRAKDAGLTREVIVAACAAALARYKVPRRVEWLDELPRNPSGKVMRRLVRSGLTAAE